MATAAPQFKHVFTALTSGYNPLANSPLANNDPIQNQSFNNCNYFIIKMSRHTQQSSNWADQRVQQIMKKYEQPYANKNRTPLANRHSNDEPYVPSSKSPWKHTSRDTPQAYRDIPQNRNDSASYKDIYGGESPHQYKNTPKRFSGNNGIEPQRKYQREDVYNRSNQQRQNREYRETKQSYNEKFSVYPSQNPSKRRLETSMQDSLLDAKQFIEQKQRKYLKTQPYEEPSCQRYQWKNNRRESLKPTFRPLFGDNVRQSEQTSKKALKDVEYQPRINNIQRINNKIKKILQSAQGSCNQREEEPYLNRTTKDRSSSKSNHHLLRGYNLNSKEIQQPPQQRKKVELIESDGRSKLQERSKSCLALKKAITPFTDYLKEPPRQVKQPKDYHKVDDKIRQLTQKIQQLQQQKRKLNISFKPLPQNLKASTPKLSVKEQLNNSFCVQSQAIQIVPEAPKASQSKGIELITNFQEEDQQFFHSPYIGLKDLDSHQVSVSIDDKQGEQEIKRITDGIEFRKKRLQISYQSNPSKKSCTESKSLLKMLSEQVQLDEKFRLAKNWFINSSQSQYISTLQDLLAERWRQMTVEQINCQFSTNVEEEDPFYSYRPDQFTLEDLVTNYIICTKHWSEKIQGKWDRSTLKQQNFYRRLDLQEKGCIEIQDIVREINMNEGVFYRNRDLYLIFLRLCSGSTELKEDRLYSVLGKK